MNILVARILGNDLEPRHAKGAQFEALKYIIENEHPPVGIDRLFVINRIKDREMEDKILRYLEDHEEVYWHMMREDVSVCGDGIEINSVRNSIIDHGRDNYYHWTFPLDGRTFLTDSSYKQMKDQCAAFAERHYAYLPQHRLMEYDEVDKDLRKDPYSFHEKRKNGAIIRNELALGFSIHSEAKFNEYLPYGHADKAEMLLVAGIAGPWVNWTAAEGERGYPVRLEVHNDEFAATYPPQYAGYALILPSGNPEADSDVEVRLAARAEGLKKIQ